VFINNTFKTTLNKGQVYYVVAPNGTTNLTGTHITSSASVSVFADCNVIGVPIGKGGDKAFQQMAPQDRGMTLQAGILITVLPHP